MAKFKVGDRVRVKKDLVGGKLYQRDNGYHLKFNERMEKYRGNVYKVRYVYSDGDYELVDIGDVGTGVNGWFFCDSMLEPEVVSFTKADLKDGMIVDVRNGNRYIVINNKLSGNDTWLAIDPYLDDLTRRNSKDYDVMKVYTTAGNTLKYMFNDRFLELIWERKEEEPVKEMTVEEIEKILGHKVKVIADEK